jgi:PAT family beta-lactamase induction signal transducer AmpG
MINYAQINTQLPVLTEHTFLRYFNFVALYFAQGIPEGMLTFGIPAWMAMNGKSPGEIAGFAVITVLPWSLKFLVAPLMDRYTYLPMGRKRPWVLLGQIGLVVSCIYMAYIPDPLNNIDRLMVAGLLVSFCGAFQDVATDGMAIDIIPPEQQAKANGLMWGSKIIGISVSLALGSWILNKYSFMFAMLTMAAIISVMMFIALILRERKGEKVTPWSSGHASSETKSFQLNNWQSIFKSLYSVFSLRNSLIIAMLLFVSQGSFKYVSTLLPIFTVKELNWTNVEYAQYYASAKLIGGIIGMLIGGILIDKFGKKRMMNFYFFSLIALNTIFILSDANWANKNFIYVFMVTQNILYTLACIGLFAIAMHCCWKKVSASQFTLYMTIANLGQMAFAVLIGPIRTNFSWQISLFIFSFFIGISWLLLQFLDIQKQMKSVEALENKEMIPKLTN